MGRHGYCDDIDTWELIKWRGAVASAIRGKRGQSFLRELRAALDAMPDKRLAANALEYEDGSACALGVVKQHRGLSVPISAVDEEDWDKLAEIFGIAPSLVREIEFQNDDYYGSDEPTEERWRAVRAWVDAQIRAPGCYEWFRHGWFLGRTLTPAVVFPQAYPGEGGLRCRVNPPAQREEAAP